MTPASMSAGSAPRSTGGAAGCSKAVSTEPVAKRVDVHVQRVGGGLPLTVEVQEAGQGDQQLAAVTPVMVSDRIQQRRLPRRPREKLAAIRHPQDRGRRRYRWGHSAAGPEHGLVVIKWAPGNAEAPAPKRAHIAFNEQLPTSLLRRPEPPSDGNLPALSQVGWCDYRSCRLSPAACAWR